MCLLDWNTDSLARNRPVPMSPLTTLSGGLHKDVEVGSYHGQEHLII